MFTTYLLLVNLFATVHQDACSRLVFIEGSFFVLGHFLYRPTLLKSEELKLSDCVFVLSSFSYPVIVIPCND